MNLVNEYLYQTLCPYSNCVKSMVKSLKEVQNSIFKFHTKKNSSLNMDVFFKGQLSEMLLVFACMSEFCVTT